MEAWNIVLLVLFIILIIIGITILIWCLMFFQNKELLIKLQLVI